jgi:hypothetical protein
MVFLKANSYKLKANYSAFFGRPRFFGFSSSSASPAVDSSSDASG